MASQTPTKIFASVEPRLDPIFTPSICRYMMLLKLNSIEEVAKFTRFLKTLSGKEGFGSGQQNRTPQQISIVFFKRNVCIERTNIKGTHKHISWDKVSNNLKKKRKRIFNTEMTKVLQNRLKHWWKTTQNNRVIVK